MCDKEYDNLINKNRHRSLLDELSSIDDIGDDDFLPSSLINNKVDSSEKQETEDEISSDEWFESLINKGKIGKPNKTFNNNDEVFSFKKKKKKKKKKDGLTDFNKEFEPEMILYQNMLKDQNKFIQSLQSQYDHLISSKSTSRGVSKITTDLIDNINSARTLSMQQVEKIINLKKTIKELTLKEKKELGINDESLNNLSDYASTYLKQIISERGKLLGNDLGGEIADYTENDMVESLSNSLSDSDRSPDIEKYLQYEHQNVSIFVVINDNDLENYEFVAKDDNGNVIDDYPLPYKTKISVNRSTGIATDSYGNKYKIIWE